MKARFILGLLLVVALSTNGQQFIGCRTDLSSTRTPGGWAETPMLRKTFTVTASDLEHYDFQTLQFTVDVTSLGYHELYINGTKVGDYVLQPAVSQLDKRVLKVTYDIKPYIHEGDNEIMLWLGQGWGRIYGTPAVAKAEVIRCVSDGECGLLYMLAWTDSTWEASPSGYSYTDNWQPLHFGGERLDARVKPDWRHASVYDAKDIIVSCQEFEGNRIVDVLEPKTIQLLADGSTLLDFGRVVTGWFDAIFHPVTPKGQEIVIEYLDHLDAKPPFTEKDIYIADGGAYHHFCNRFHTHTFRYVHITGAGRFESHYQALQISAVDPDSGATFSCSDSRLNAIHDMVKYTLSCLTFSGYMVDCPHIERMGYGGDGNSSTMTLQTLWNVSDIYANWLTAWGDAQLTSSTKDGVLVENLDEGDLPYVAPAFRTGGGPYWSGFIIKAPWRTYINYGALALIRRHYYQMKRWLRFVENHCVDDILQPWPDTERRSWFLGDWAVPEGVDKGGESVLHVNSCFLSECLADMVQMANLLGRTTDAERFDSWRQRLNASIHRHFYHSESHTYANGTPLDQCYALLLGIPPDSATAAAVKEQLLKDCHGKYRDHIAAGLMGVPIFTEWCIRERQTDLMATILRQPDYPGYLNMINQGATTTWESWDCGRPGKEDRSRVHNCYNGIGIWFYQALAGIRPDPEHPGHKHFFIDPQPCKDVDWVKCTKPTPYGTIKVEIVNGELAVEVPENTTATVFPGSPRERTVAAGKWVIPIK
ncbi:MAG: family 78 glycoside hydrolase catalytic domain [Bacteroidales bacterium]|nr:family 78 glycoside hydrolase catalytic domain [Bacteroidales bacterium]